MSGLVATFVEAPRALQETLTVPQNHYDVCAAGHVPVVGNAAAHSVDWLDLGGQPAAKPPLPDGYVPRLHLSLQVPAGLTGPLQIYDAGHRGLGLQLSFRSSGCHYRRLVRPGSRPAGPTARLRGQQRRGESVNGRESHGQRRARRQFEPGARKRPNGKLGDRKATLIGTQACRPLIANGGGRPTVPGMVCAQPLHRGKTHHHCLVLGEGVGGSAKQTLARYNKTAIMLETSHFWSLSILRRYASTFCRTQSFRAAALVAGLWRSAAGHRKHDIRSVGTGRVRRERRMASGRREQDGVLRANPEHPPKDRIPRDLYL